MCNLSQGIEEYGMELQSEKQRLLSICTRKAIHPSR